MKLVLGRPRVSAGQARAQHKAKRISRTSNAFERVSHWTRRGMRPLNGGARAGLR